ncbi:MAG: PAS domain S-box protein, partial [Candidatus Thorarchaeota archaeon]
ESVHPDDRELVKSSVDAAIYNKEPYSLDHRIIRPDGSIRYVHEEGEVTFNEKGKPVQMMGTVQDITERIEIESLLREERDKAKRYLDLAGTMILALDTSFNVTMINQKGCDLLGYTENEVVGKNWVESFIPKHLHEQAYDHFKALLSSEHKEGPCCNFSIVTKSGEEKTIQCQDTAIYDDKGNVVTILCSAQIIGNTLNGEASEEILVSRAFITDEEMFRQIFEESPICIELFDSDGILTGANRQTVELFGVEGAEDLIGFDLFNDPNTPDIVKEELRKGNSISLETRFDFSRVHHHNHYESSKTGIMHLQNMYSPLRYGREEGLQGYIIHIQDVTDRYVAEQALMESRESFKELYSNALIGLFRVRISDGMILECNDQFATIFNFENRQILIDSSCFFKDFLSGPNAWTQLKSKIKEHERLVTELAVTTKDNQRLWLRFSLRVWPEKGHIEGVMSDITQEKQALQMLSKQKEELSDFAHTMSHDLKNIFQNMVGFIELIEDENDLTHLARLHALVFETSQLVDHSVALADAGLIVEEQLVEVDLDKLVRLVAESTIPELIEYIQDPLPVVRADEMKVTQIFRNLFDNAVNHGEPTKIEVKCEVRQGRSSILIRNNGKEIPEAIRTKIFLKGFTTSKSGQGFGLTIIKRIVDAHTWTIHLAPSRMTTFELIIPKQDSPK